MNRQQYLLAFVLVLLIVKFTIVPLAEMASVKAEEVDALQLRYDKGESRLASLPDIKRHLDIVDNALSQSQESFLSAASGEAAQLSFQKQVEELALDTQVTVVSLEWLSVTAGNPETALVELKIKGPYLNSVRLLTGIEQLGIWVKAKDMNLRVNGQKLQQRRIGEMQGSIVFQMFYVVESNDAA